MADNSITTGGVNHPRNPSQSSEPSWMTRDYWTSGTSLEDRQKDQKYLYHLADNLVGFEDEYDTKGEKFGRNLTSLATAIKEDPIGIATSIGQNAFESLERLVGGPDLIMAQNDLSESPENRARAEQEHSDEVLNWSTALMSPAARNAMSLDRDTLNIFGGFKAAEDPGYARSGKMLPKSVGADDERRFEIPDDEAVLVQGNVSKVRHMDEESLNKVSTLGDVLIHDELFHQYPELKDIKVVYDEGINPSYRGYFNYDKNLIALNPSSGRTAEEELDTILHEIQHSVQNMEGFDLGTNPSSEEVSDVIRKVFGNVNVDQYKEYQKLRSFRKEVVQDPEAFKIKMLDYLADLAESRGMSYEDFIYKDRNDVDIDPDQRGILHLRDEFSHLFNLASDDPENLNYTFSFPVGALKTYIGGYDRGAEHFEEVFGIPVEGLKVLQGAPQKPLIPLQDPNTRYQVYSTKSGEVEARNVASRRKMPPQERATTSPVRTEDVPREDQWISGFNKGGSVEQETKEVFQGVDPVSGNEIPVGSSAKEVRDDVDAKLSENEYVIPADVVRFYGVNHFEKLISKAKEGYARMVEDGRFGGQAPGQEDELPFSDEELMVEEDQPVAMAKGGLVTMAEGGQVPAAAFNPNSYTTGFSTFTGNNPMESFGSGIQTKIYINSAGERRTVMFSNGIPIQTIPDGFVEDTPSNRETFKAANTTSVQPVTESTRETGSDDDNYGKAEGADYTKMTPEQIEKEVRAGQALAGIVGGAFAGPFGAKGVRDLAIREQRKELEEQGIPKETIDDILGKGKTRGNKLGNLLDTVFPERQNRDDIIGVGAKGNEGKTAKPDFEGGNQGQGGTNGYGSGEADYDKDESKKSSGYRSGGLVSRPKSSNKNKSGKRSLATRR